MDEPYGPLILVLLAIPALALRLAVRALFGRRRLGAEDGMQSLLTMSSTILFFAAGLGLVIGLIGGWILIVPAVVIAVFLLLMTIDRTRRAEHRALVWSLSVAAQKEIPLSEAARAYADETLGDTGRRALALAFALERGEPLAQAARSARLRMGTAMKLAVQLGERLGLLGPAMRQQLDAAHQIDATLSVVVGRLFYLVVAIGALSSISTFCLLKIVPVFQKMFDEFGLKLPPITVAVIDFAKGSANVFPWLSILAFGFTALLVLGGAIWGAVFIYDMIDRVWPLDPADPTGKQVSTLVRRTRMVIRGIGAFAAFVLLCLILWPSLLGILFLPILLYYIGWFPRDLPVVWRFFKRYDGALVMRGLALSIRRGLPLPQALTLLRDEYPLRHVSRQLGKALERVQQGQDWCASLRQTGLIGRADAAVLAAAQRVGNLQWALEEMADSALRRQAQWILAATQVLYPIALLVLASFVFFFVVGMFAPLVSLIQGLT